MYNSVRMSSPLKMHPFQSAGAVILGIVTGKRPDMTPEISPDGQSYALLWKLAERGWSQDPVDRPRALEMVQALVPGEASSKIALPLATTSATI